MVPFPEVFSRHSGTCFVVGDRNNVGTPFQIKVGDCFRLGSVGLVVSEMKLPDQDEQKLDAKTLQFLKDEALAFDTNEEWAALASDELLSKGGELFKKGADKDNDNNSEKNGGRTVAADAASVISQEDDIDRTEHFAGSGGVIGSSSEKFFCYMCYEMHNTTEDPLIAPCDCRGDTRFLHVQCLQKWYHSSVVGSHAQVIRTTGNGAPACKICGAAYKTNFRRQDGRKASILEVLTPPDSLFCLSFYPFYSFVSVGEQWPIFVFSGRDTSRYQPRSFQHEIPPELRPRRCSGRCCSGPLGRRT